jgi:hypothetical protein
VGDYLAKLPSSLAADLRSHLGLNDTRAGA